MSSGKFQGETTQSLEDIRCDIKEIKEFISSEDRRISSLEKWRWILTGGMIALGLTNWPNILKIAQAFAIR